jgi:uncharacterized membrane protein
MSKSWSSTARSLLAIALFLGSALSASTAGAQTPKGPDLVVLQAYVANIEGGSCSGNDGGPQDQAIVGNCAHVVINVQNQGDQTFTPSPGQTWEIKWGINDTSDCPYQTPQQQQTSCVLPQTALNGSIGPSQTVRYQFDWTPSPQNAGVAALATRIQSVTSTGGAQGPEPAPNDQNNDRSFPIFIRSLGVFAVPDVPSGPPSDPSHLNAAWGADEIKDDCPKTDPATKACKVQPGGIVTFQYKVQNAGNTADSYYGRVMDPTSTNSPSSLANRGWRFVFSPQNFSLDKGEVQEVQLQIIVPAGEKAITSNGTNVGGANVTNVVVDWSSRLDPSKTSAQPPTSACDPNVGNGLCQDPAFPSLLIGIKHGLNATSNETLRLANVTEVTTFNVTLENTGNAADTYQLSLDNDTAAINTSWNYDIPWLVNVPAFSKTVVTFSLTPPKENATMGLHPFNVSFQSIADTDGSTHQTLRFNANVQQNFEIGATLDTGLIRVYPDQKAGYIMRIQNRGNGVDNVALQLQNVPYQWQAQLSQTVVPVPAFSTALVYLNVTPAPDAPEQYNATFFVNGTSSGPCNQFVCLAPDQRSHFSLGAQLQVQRGPNIRVTAVAPTAFVDPGATTNYTLTVTNTGNLRNTFSVAVNRTEDQLAWSTSVTPTSITLDPLQSGTVNVALTAPNSGAVGETTKVFVTLTAAFDSGIFNQTTLVGQVSGPDLFTDSILANATNPYSGDPLQLSVVLGNAGNKAPDKNVTLRVYFVQEGVPLLIAQKTYAPNELPGGRRVTEAFTWDTTGIQGSGALLAALDENNQIAEIDETNNNATRPITLRTFDIEITPAQGLSGVPGEHVSYSAQPNVFLVTYNGNQPSEPVDLVLTSDHGWLGDGKTELHPPGIALPRGTPIQVLADVYIPDSPGVPSDTLRLSIVPQLRPESIVTSTTTTTVVDHDLPVIADVGATPSTGVLGTPVTIHATVHDTTGLSSVRAYVVRPDNVTDTYLMDANGSADGLYTSTQPFTIAGTYRLYVEAIDASDAQNKNTSRDTVATFTVQPGSAPVIALAGDQLTTVRTGSFVRFNITDPLGIKDATYQVRGISYDLGRFPFQIDTSSMTDGTYNVTVIAHNIYDVETRANFTITVDNTPPGIRGVTLDPPAPKANQDVTVRVTTDAKVETVDILVKKDGQVIDTRPAVKKASGVFELLLNPGEGSYTIDVTAKDAAGNTKLETSAVSFTAKPASPFNVPAPGVALVGLVAVALALLLRRRL